MGKKRRGINLIVAGLLQIALALASQACLAPPAHAEGERPVHHRLNVSLAPEAGTARVTDTLTLHPEGTPGWASFGACGHWRPTDAWLVTLELANVFDAGYRVHGYTAGGLTGELVGEVCLGLFHHAGTYLVALAVMCAGLATISGTMLAGIPRCLQASCILLGGNALISGLNHPS